MRKSTSFLSSSIHSCADSLPALEDIKNLTSGAWQWMDFPNSKQILHHFKHRTYFYVRKIPYGHHLRYIVCASEQSARARASSGRGSWTTNRIRSRHQSRNHGSTGPDWLTDLHSWVLTWRLATWGDGWCHTAFYTSSGSTNSQGKFEIFFDLLNIE